MNDTAKKNAGRNDQRLSQKMEKLEECLLAPMAARTQTWARRVGRALDEVRETWNQHQMDAESEDGPFSPDEFKGTMVPDLLRIRRRGRLLLEEIRKHKEKETILLMDNVTVDIGVGD